MPKKKKASASSAEAEKKVLSGWINDKLGEGARNVTDLSKDLQDGVILINLLEKLSGKIIPEKFPGKPTKTSQKAQNISAILSFLNDVEHISIESLAPLSKNNTQDIVDMVWKLVSHYALQGNSNALLLDWLSSVLSMEIKDFTVSWSDGLLLLALVNYCRPGLVPDLASIDPANARENISQAISLAAEHFFIPPLISPDEMVQPVEKCVLTYLSYFTGPKSPALKSLFLWVTQNLPPEESVTNLDKDWPSGRILGALINTLTNGGLPEYDNFLDDDSVDNCAACLETAQRLLGVEPSLSASQLASPHLDLLSRTSYLLQLQTATHKVQVADIHHPSSPHPGEMMWVDLSFKGNSSMIKSQASGNTVGSLPTLTETLEDGKYRISFETASRDDYSLELTVGGLRVQGSPFTTSLCPAQPLSVVHKGTILPRKVGIPLIISFDVSLAGQGELSAEAVGSLSGPTPLNIENSSPENIKLSLIPMEKENFTVTVRYSDVEVPGSPFVLELDSLVSPESIVVGKPLAVGPGNPVVTSVDASKAGDGRLTATCVGDISEELDVCVHPQGEGLYELIFTPPVLDVCYLSIAFDSSEIDCSPIKVDLYPPPPIASKVVLSAPPSDALASEVPVTLCFNTASAGTGVLTARCSGQQQGEIPVIVAQLDSGTDYQLTFTPPQEDSYKLEVFWSDTPIRGSPFTLDLISEDHPLPEKCRLSGVPDRLLLTDEELQFVVETGGAGRATLTVTNETPPSSQSADSATDESPPADEELKTNSESAANDLESLPTESTPANPTESENVPTKLDTETETKTETETEIHIETENEPKIEVDKKTQIETESDSKEDKVSVTKGSDGQYTVSYTPRQPGSHTLNILWSGEHIPGSPLLLNVHKPHMATVGSRAVVNLTTVYKRKHLKAFVVPSEGEGQKLKVKMEKIASGNYNLIFQSSEPGVYLMHVSTKSQPIEGSPFIINYIEPKADPSVIQVTGIREEAVVGEPMQFVINARDAGHGDVTVAPLGSVYSMDSALTRDMDVRSIYLRDNKDGTYSAVFTPDSAGETGLDIRFRGEGVPGSPFPVNVLHRQQQPDKKGKKNKKGKGAGSLISGLNLQEEKFMVGTAHKFKIHCDDLGEGELEVSTKPHTAADIEVTHDANENSYWVEILPKRAGKNDILVKFDGGHILGSPFRVVFLSRGDAAKCSLIDTPADCQRELSGGKVSFCISTKGSGKGKVSAGVKSLSTKNEIPCEVIRENKSHYHVMFSPSQGLNYLLSVRYDEIHINGSPYKIALGDASLCTVEGGGLSQSWAERWNGFRINVADAGPGELTVEIEADDPEETDIEGLGIEQNVSNVDEDHYEVSYRPAFPGRYWVTIKWGGMAIPGSPFQVTCSQPLSPAQFTVQPVSLTHQGKPANLQVVCDSPINEPDKLSITVHNQADERILGEAVRNQDTSSYTATIAPPQLESYLVFILWDGQHVTGSPFEISNVPPPTPNEFSIAAVDGGSGNLSVSVTGPRYSFLYGSLTADVRHALSGAECSFPVSVCKESDERAIVAFTPDQGGEYMLSIKYDELHVNGSPYQLLSTDAAQCYARGKGLSQARVGASNNFTVFTENGGPGELRVEVTKDSESHNALVSAVTETRYEVSYSPEQAGLYQLALLWDSQHIPNSPYTVKCCDPARYSVPKPPTEGSLGRPIRIGIKESSPAPEFESLEIYASTKDHVRYPGSVDRGRDGGLIAHVTPPKVGKYLIHIQCNGFELEGSPFKIRNYPAPRPEKVRAEGEGLRASGVVVGERGTFRVSVEEAGRGFLSLKVQGPKNGFRTSIKRDPEDDDVMLGEFNPLKAGDYSLSLLWSGEHIPNSPFTVHVSEGQTLSSLQAAGSDNE